MLQYLENTPHHPNVLVIFNSQCSHRYERMTVHSCTIHFLNKKNPVYDLIVIFSCYLESTYDFDGFTFQTLHSKTYLKPFDNLAEDALLRICLAGIGLADYGFDDRELSVGLYEISFKLKFQFLFNAILSAKLRKLWSENFSKI